MSHNVYSVDTEITSTSFPKYLIYNGTHIFFATCITDAIKTASSEGKICSIFERPQTGKYWAHLVDCSKGVL